MSLGGKNMDILQTHILMLSKGSNRTRFCALLEQFARRLQK